jgi:hypothetical protein
MLTFKDERKQKDYQHPDPKEPCEHDARECKVHKVPIQLDCSYIARSSSGRPERFFTGLLWR